MFSRYSEILEKRLMWNSIRKFESQEDKNKELKKCQALVHNCKFQVNSVSVMLAKREILYNAKI